MLKQSPALIGGTLTKANRAPTISVMSPVLMERLKRLRSRLAVPGYLIVAWSIIGGWSDVEFAFQKMDEFLQLRYSRPILLLVGILWLTWVIQRPESKTQQRLSKIRELLWEAAADLRSEREDTKDLDEASRGAYRHMKLLFFLDSAFSSLVCKHYSEWLEHEQGKWKEADQSFPVYTETARYLEELANRITVKDIDQGFYLPETYEQFRRAQNWQPNRRPVSG